MFSRKQAGSRQNLPPITPTQRLILITLAMGVFMGSLDMSILSSCAGNLAAKCGIITAQINHMYGQEGKNNIVP